MSELQLQTVNDLLIAQMAAESYLHQIPPGNSVDERRVVLQLGNNNPSFFSNPDVADLPGKTRMTESQRARFAQIYEIVAHQPNTWTGFSATLFKNRGTGEYVLSFRSTEYPDDSRGGDWLRDGIAGADGEISSFGFAVAQVADAEAWFRGLKSSGTLPTGA